MKRIVLILVVCLLLTSVVAATRSDTINLLTVSRENTTQEKGGTATMNLQLSPGDGNVFIDSFPLTQLDTQISTRFAKEVACEFTEKNCDNVNFYYTIRASSTVVGGPSAGAAAAVLTSSVLENKSVAEDTVITGTVNSGGYIGPVGGIDPKIEAAKQAGFETVVIPKYSRLSNGTTVVRESPRIKDDVHVETVSELREAYKAFTSTNVPASSNISVTDEYQRTMRSIAQQLCRRNDQLLADLQNTSLSGPVRNETMNSKQNAQQALQEQNYYSAASYCFGANIDLRDEVLDEYSEDERAVIKQTTIEEAKSMLSNVQERPINTMSDIEASIIVKERLYEILDEDIQDERSTAYLVERLDSARAWSAFFNYSSQPVSLDDEYLKEACLSKLKEAEERVRYLEFLLPQIEQYQDSLEQTRDSYQDQDYTYCLFKGSQLKADANNVITGRTISEDYRPDYVQDKLKIAQRQIAEQQTFFPILGYSYYTYAKSLRTEQPQLAALFTEYASEFSALNMYFPTDNYDDVAFSDSARPITCPVTNAVSDSNYQHILQGIVIGLLLGSIGYIAVRKWRKE